MYVIRKADLLAGVSENWRLAHQRRGEWLAASGARHPQEVYDELVALGAKPQADAIAAVTGDTRWTEMLCQECGQDVDLLVAFGAGEVSHQTDTAVLCMACLEAGLQLARAPLTRPGT